MRSIILWSKRACTSHPGTAGGAWCRDDLTYPPGRNAVQLSIHLPAVLLAGSRHRVLGLQRGQQGLQEGLQLLQLAALQPAGTFRQLLSGLWCLVPGSGCSRECSLQVGT